MNVLHLASSSPPPSRLTSVLRVGYGDAPIHRAWRCWLDEKVGKMFKKSRMATVENIFGLLLKHHANCNTERYYTMETPLHQAAKHGSLAVVKKLLAHGAVHDALDKDGKSPGDIANDRGFHELACVLKNWKHLDNEYKLSEFRNVWETFLEDEVGWIWRDGNFGAQ